MELNADFITNYYNVCCHIGKHPTLLDTVKQIPNTSPYQIFLNGPQNTNISVKDDDIRRTAEYIDNNKLNVFIHSPYILNLANEFVEGEWQYKLFRKYLEVGVSMKAKGVVIHVAKHTKQPYSSAITAMRKNLEVFKQFASVDCPILLETPAGQGTETLTKRKEFCDFVQEFNDERIRVCVDTCHVFASGHQPLEYLQYIVENHRSLLKLVHYNDSQDACGSCLDRHAFIGTGKIGLLKMTEIAHFCKVNNTPMVVE